MDRGFIWGAAAILLIGMVIAAAVAGIAWAWAWYQAQVSAAAYSSTVAIAEVESTPFWDFMDSILGVTESAASAYAGG